MIETIILEISSYCNGSCITCLNRVMKRKKGFMDFDLFKSLIDQIVNERLCECVNLFGVGERTILV